MENTVVFKVGIDFAPSEINSGTPAEISACRIRFLKNSPLSYPQFTDRQKAVHNPTMTLNCSGNGRDNLCLHYFLLSGGFRQS